MTYNEQRPGDGHRGAAGAQGGSEDEANATDLWLDRDGMIYSGDGPYLNRPMRRLLRAVRRWLR